MRKTFALAGAGAAAAALAFAAPAYATPTPTPAPSETVTTPPPGGGDPTGAPTTPPPSQPPAFSFGYDDVQLSSRQVVPGGSTTFTVTCPTAVTITGNGFTQSPLTVTKVGENTWRGTGTFKQTLPNPTTATVICKDHGAVKYTTDPGDGNGGDMKPKPGTRIPTGPINTGDGTLYLEQRGGDSAMPLMAAGAGAALAAGLGVVVLRRRTARGRS
ncbi:hypothetical protein [Thermomonospora amylolytica]|uniref:hypothetical protein n=1 Tax=Thermomonospora amylolytica TaxID=1411117 RepID=UPI000E6BAADF|nr:hypothetical protein [Thermomonospora amylolytica]